MKGAAMSHESVALLRRWFQEVWNERRAATIDELLHPQSVCRADDDILSGVADFKARMYEPFVAAFPDLRLEIDAILSDGDQAVVRWRATGTHTREGLGFPPSGRIGSFHGMTWVRIRDGKLIEGWQSSNISNVLRSLRE
jgi:steroid delta-isomerase-like uncharacterized protein